MAFPTAVNDQITDSVTQANTKVLEDAPAVAMGNFMIATSQALSNAAHNATSGQQQAAVIAQAAMTQGISTLYSIDTASVGVATTQIFTMAVVPETIIGHIHTKLFSPSGKIMVQDAIQQAQESPKVDNLTNSMKTTQKEIETAIKKAKKEGLSNQSICFILNKIAEESGVNLLYPALSAPDLTQEQIETYYSAMIESYYATVNS